MKPSEEVKQFVLKRLAKTSVDNKKAYNALLKDLRTDYADDHWINDLLISMDYNHAKLLNLQLEQDAQSSLTGVIVSSAANFLTPDGEAEARDLN